MPPPVEPDITELYFLSQPSKAAEEFQCSSNVVRVNVCNDKKLEMDLVFGTFSNRFGPRFEAVWSSAIDQNQVSLFSVAVFNQETIPMICWKHVDIEHYFTSAFLQ